MHGDASKYAWFRTKEYRQEARILIRIKQRYLQEQTPAGRRLLSLMLNAYNANFGSGLNRKQIASVLGRPQGLTPHDRNLLNRLCESGFIESRRLTLWTEDRRARGSEIIYHMDEDTAWALNVIRRKQRKKKSTA